MAASQATHDDRAARPRQINQAAAAATVISTAAVHCDDTLQADASKVSSREPAASSLTTFADHHGRKPLIMTNKADPATTPSPRRKAIIKL